MASLTALRALRLSAVRVPRPLRPAALTAAVALVAVTVAGGVAGAGTGSGGDHALAGAVLAAAAAAPAPLPAAVAVAPVRRARPAPPRPVAPVARLGALAPPDALVVTGSPLSPEVLAAVRAMPAVTSVTEVDTGSLVVDGRPQRALGVDPSTFRAVTPAPSAASDGLWQVVARGELALAFARGASADPRLGRELTVRAAGTRRLRVGAVAAFGLDAAQVVVNRDLGHQLGLRSGTGLVVSAPQLEAGALRDRLAALTGGEVTLLGQDAAAVDVVSGTAPGGRPRSWRELYMSAAATCPGLSWTVLAAIGQVESDHGRNVGVSSAGAVGPMQFLPATFAQYAVDGDGDGRADPLNAFDAVPTAARMLCTDGAGRGGAALSAAVFAYNHADWYVAEVLALAQRYH